MPCESNPVKGRPPLTPRCLPQPGRGCAASCRAGRPAASAPAATALSSASWRAWPRASSRDRSRKILVERQGLGQAAEGVERARHVVQTRQRVAVLRPKVFARAIVGLLEAYRRLARLVRDVGDRSSVLRVVHHEQQPGGRKACHQTVEQGLGFRIDPVQVLEDHQQRLHLAFPEQDALEGVERALAALGWLEKNDWYPIAGGARLRHDRSARRLSRRVPRRRASPGSRRHEDPGGARARSAIPPRPPGPLRGGSPSRPEGRALSRAIRPASDRPQTDDAVRGTGSR